jgi:hypothetical protein
LCEVAKEGAMATVKIEVTDFEAGMTLTVKLDNEEYVYEIDDGEPDEEPGEAGGDEAASLEVRRFAFGGKRG